MYVFQQDAAGKAFTVAVILTKTTALSARVLTEIIISKKLITWQDRNQVQCAKISLCGLSCRCAYPQHNSFLKLLGSEGIPCHITLIGFDDKFYTKHTFYSSRCIYSAVFPLFTGFKERFEQ